MYGILIFELIKNVFSWYETLYEQLITNCVLG